VILLLLSCIHETDPVELVPIGWSCTDDDQDGFCEEEDCNDHAFEIYPDALEICDGLDGDCDGFVDEGVELRAYLDRDGDGHGSVATQIHSCVIPDGYAPTGGDCDDEDPRAYPGATELCEETDEDCDGLVDEGLEYTFWLDADQDGFGDPDVAISACRGPEFFMDNGLDCDDTDAAVFPGAVEVCDTVDGDCDGEVDEGVVPTWYLDADGDGHGDKTTAIEVCDAPSGFVLREDDCDDNDVEVNPGMPEICNGKDDDCDGSRDEPSAIDAPTWYQDADLDDYGDVAVPRRLCHDLPGWVEDHTDCDDTQAEINPGAPEVCNGLDDNCDGTVDPDYFSSALDTATTMQVNGDALQVWDGSNGYLLLTDTSTWQAGSAVYPTAIPGNRWNVQFSASIGGGDGGEGMAMVLLDESDATLVGDPGDSLGASPLTGWAITLDSRPEEHLGIAECSTLEEEESVEWSFQDEGWIAVEVEYDMGALDIWLDGNLATSTTLSPMPASVLVGWTAATGSLTNEHSVDDVTIGCP